MKDERFGMDNLDRVEYELFKRDMDERNDRRDKIVILVLFVVADIAAIITVLCGCSWLALFALPILVALAMGGGGDGDAIVAVLVLLYAALVGIANGSIWIVAQLVG